MMPVEMATAPGTNPGTDDAIEVAVLVRARRNFLDNGLGDRMWADPSAPGGSTMSACFALNEDERATFIADARAEIENERTPSLSADADGTGARATP